MIYDSIVLELDMKQKESEFQILESMLEDYEKQYMIQKIYQEGIGDERKEYRKSGESMFVSILKFIGRLINNIIYRIRRLFGYKGKQADPKSLTTSNGNDKPAVTQTIEKTTEKIEEEVKQNPSIIDQYLESHKEDEFEEDGYEIEIIRENKYVSATKKIQVINASANVTFAVRLKDNVPKIVWTDNFDEDGYKALLTYANNLITALAEMKKFESSLSKAKKSPVQGIIEWKSNVEKIDQQIFDNRNCFLDKQKKSEDVENFDKYDDLIKLTLTVMSKLEELHKQQNEMVQTLTSTNTSKDINTQIGLIYGAYKRCANRLIKTINDYIAFFEKRGEPEFYLLKKVCNNGDAKKRTKDLSKDLEFTKDIQNMPDYNSLQDVNGSADKSKSLRYKEEPPNGMEILHQDLDDIFVKKGQTIIHQMHTPLKKGKNQIRLSVYIMGREGNNDKSVIEHIKKEGGRISVPIDFILEHIPDYQTLSDITAGNFDQNKLGSISEGKQKIITKHADEIKDILDFLTNGKTPLPKRSSKQDVADNSDQKQDVVKDGNNTDVLSIYNANKRTNDQNNGVEVLTHYYDNDSSKDLIFHKNGNVSLYREKYSYRIMIFKDGKNPYPTKRILETSSMSLSDIRKAIENNGDGLPELNTEKKREEFVKFIPAIIELFKFFGITINVNTSPSTKRKNTTTSNPKQDVADKLDQKQTEELQKGAEKNPKQDVVKKDNNTSENEPKQIEDIKKSNPKQDVAGKPNDSIRDETNIQQTGKETTDSPHGASDVKEQKEDVIRDSDISQNGVKARVLYNKPHYFCSAKINNAIMNVSMHMNEKRYTIYIADGPNDTTIKKIIKDGSSYNATSLNGIFIVQSVSLVDIQNLFNDESTIIKYMRKSSQKALNANKSDIIKLCKFHGIDLDTQASPSTKLKDTKHEPKQIEDAEKSNPKQDIKEETKTEMENKPYRPKNFNNEVNKQYAEFCKNKIQSISNIISPTAIDKFNKICDNFDENNDDIEDFVEELRGLVEKYLQGSFTKTTENNWRNIEKVMDNIGFKECRLIKTGVDLNSTITSYRKKTSMLFDRPIPVSINDPDLNFKIKSIQLMPRRFHFISDDGASNVAFVKGSCSYYKYDGPSQKSDNKSQDVKPES